MLRAQDESELRELGDQVTETILANDWPAYALLHTEDAVRYSATISDLRGRHEIEHAFSAFRVLEFTQEIEHIEGDGDYALVTVWYSMETEHPDHPGTMHDNGRALIGVQRQEDGRWLMSRALTTPLGKAKP